MEDPRIILKQKLIKVGILPQDANLIALEAGSSQALVNKKYLISFQYSEKIRKKALNVVRLFYNGHFIGDKGIN